MGVASRISLSILLLGGLAFACATIPRGPGERLPRGPGERLHLSKCGACHKRPARGGYDDARWRKILEGHRKRFPLTDSEIAELSAFLAGQGEAR